MQELLESINEKLDKIVIALERIANNLELGDNRWLDLIKLAFISH